MLFTPCFREEVDTEHLAYVYDLLDIAACNASLELSDEARRAAARVRELHLREAKLGAALAHDGSQIGCVADLAVDVAGLSRCKRFHEVRSLSRNLPVWDDTTYVARNLTKWDELTRVCENLTKQDVV